MIGTVNEDFAIESLAGDIFQLGNTSWRILRVEHGKVRVEDAGGQPPTIPFWLGEAPARGDELYARGGGSAQEGSRSRASKIGTPLSNGWCRSSACRPPAPSQIVAYLGEALRMLGALPTLDTLQ